MSDGVLVAVVTGASRGAGRGIAAALAARGWTVYVTGRSIAETPPGGVAVPMDHADDAAVAGLFDQIRREAGRLDLLVNNAAVVSDQLVNPKPFWEKPLDLADVLDVGLRSSYVASWYAAPLLLEAERGLIAFTSSPGSVAYMHGPAYGAQKAGVDKMAADMAVDFAGSSPQNPTPQGLFALSEIVPQSNPRGFYGPFILTLSAHSDRLSDFDGGQGQVAIHGTNLPGLLGGAVSHGCVRMPNTGIKKVAKLVPPGAPVEILP